MEDLNTELPFKILQIMKFIGKIIKKNCKDEYGDYIIDLRRNNSTLIRLRELSYVLYRLLKYFFNVKEDKVIVKLNRVNL